MSALAGINTVPGQAVPIAFDIDNDDDIDIIIGSSLGSLLFTKIWDLNQNLILSSKMVHQILFKVYLCPAAHALLWEI